VQTELFEVPTNLKPFEIARVEKVKAILGHLELILGERKRRYLNTKHWKALRQKKIEEVGEACQRCGLVGNGNQTDVNHLNYRSLYDVTLDDLEVLCQPCHAQYGIEHGQHGGR